MRALHLMNVRLDVVHLAAVLMLGVALFAHGEARAQLGAGPAGASEAPPANSPAHTPKKPRIEAPRIDSPRIKAPRVMQQPKKTNLNIQHAPKVRAIAFKLGEIDDEENASLQRYLADLIGKPATRARLDEAEQRLAALRRYERARCSVYGHGTHGSVVCDVWRARVLREVTVEGLPGAILETDLMKRVFLRSGEPLDEDEAVGT